MSDVLRGVPEFFEADCGEALQMRADGIAQYKELGPPDLVHITKESLVKADAPRLGSFHHVFGVDASSMASLAAYINTLLYAQSETQGWFGKGREWRIVTGVYCCYNAFSRVDMHVEVNIPGGTESFMIDARGERHDTTPDMWQETYLSAMIRALLYSDDHKYPLRAFRRRDPIPDLAAEQRFLECIEECFWKGPQLGTDPEIQIATSSRNHLTRALLRYFAESGRWELAASMLERLTQHDAETASLLARAYFGMDAEVRGVRVLCDAVKRLPSSYLLLLEQVEFLRRKRDLESARDLAKFAIDAAPSEFVTWAALADVYSDLKDPRNALLSLNSCPMFTFHDRDRPRMPMPVRAHYVVKPDPITGERINELDPDTDGGSLPRLAGAHLRGTFAAAYHRLARLVADCSWDDLLRYRSQVFVMEDEYRQVKAQEEEHKRSTTPRPEAKKVEKDLPKPAPPEPRIDLDRITIKTDEATPETEHHGSANTGPVQPESSEKEQEAVSSAPKASATTQDSATDAPPPSKDPPAPRSHASASSSSSSSSSSDDDDNDDDDDVWGPTKQATGEKSAIIISKPEALDKPSALPASDHQAASQRAMTAPPSQEHAASDAKPASGKTEAAAKPSYTPFSNKRLCERWLDNLFMVLYEDLRAFTIWRAEVAHHQKNGTVYNRPLADVESLGDLALRLLKPAEAQEAYEHVVANKYSVHSWTKLLEIYTDRDDVQRALEAVVYLAKYHDCHFNDVIYPHTITKHLNRLIRTHGLGKIKNTLISIPYVSEASQKLVQRYLDYAKTFGVEGAEN